MFRSDGSTYLISTFYFPEYFLARGISSNGNKTYCTTAIRYIKLDLRIHSVQFHPFDFYSFLHLIYSFIYLFNLFIYLMILFIPPLLTTYLQTHFSVFALGLEGKNSYMFIWSTTWPTSWVSWRITRNSSHTLCNDR